MTSQRRRLLLIVPVVYITVILVTRLLTLGVVHMDRPLAVQLIAVPLVQTMALAAVFALAGRRRR